jgi:hypothetical protein
VNRCNVVDMTDPKADPSKLFAPVEKAILEAFVLRSGTKALASLRPLMWLAYLALAQWFGLAHIITPEMRAVATDLARRPGRRKAEPDGQSSLFESIPMNDGRPGVYVSFVRLRIGNVRESSGDAVLDLHGCHEPTTAIVRAYEQGWIGGPSGNGLRFIPPTIWGLVQDHSSAGFARNGGVDEYIATLLGRIDKLETSIAEGARLPTAELSKEPCPHKSVTLFDGERTCNSCKATLPKLENEKVATFRKKSHDVLTTNEDPREPNSSRLDPKGAAARAKTTARQAKRLGAKKPTSKGRAS